MRALLLLLWIAGFVQLAIASANLFLAGKLNYRENLFRVSPIIRQIFVVHSLYIVGVVLLFAAITFGFSGDLASGHGLGRFLAAAIAVFWLARAPVQLLYYDAVLRRENRWGDMAFTSGALFLAAAYGAASFAHGL
jgi:phosphoglycerol transferase MdoB-like AlkP superfamily enzyme